MTNETCPMCLKYAEFCTEQGKEHPPFMGKCLPFRCKNEGILSVCRAPSWEVPDFAAWCDLKWREAGNLELGDGNPSRAKALI
jgi:hypothetical protein